MSVASHANYIRSSHEDLERASGRLEILAKTHTNQHLADAAHGASVALRAMADYDIKTDEDMLTIWSMLMTQEGGGEVE